MLTYVSDHAKEYTTTYGNMSSQSVGAIQRALIAVEDQEGDTFFGEPAPELSDWFVCDANGHEYVSILNAPCAAWPTRLHLAEQKAARASATQIVRGLFGTATSAPTSHPTQPQNSSMDPLPASQLAEGPAPYISAHKTPRLSANLNPAASRPPRYFSLFAMAWSIS